MEKKLIKIMSAVTAVVAISTLSFSAGRKYESSAPEIYTEGDLAIVETRIMAGIGLTKKEFAHLDVNKDGEIDSIDYVMISNRLCEDVSLYHQ